VTSAQSEAQEVARKLATRDQPRQKRSVFSLYPRPDEGSWAADVEALCHDLVRLGHDQVADVRDRHP